jgi:hypothetical protein
MEYPTNFQLKLMARSLQELIVLANKSNLRFTAQLLAMAVMEIMTNIHGISEQELVALCERIEEKSALDEKHDEVSRPDFRGGHRRPRARRNRTQ